MALYGVDGLTPILTAISTDERVVRTLYRLESGATLEVEQLRATAETGSVGPAPAVGPGIAVQSRAEIAADVAAPGPRVWSGLRGNVRITLRTPSAEADLAALAMKLRVD
jgi:hypothetical protein